MAKSNTVSPQPEQQAEPGSEGDKPSPRPREGKASKGKKELHAAVTAEAKEEPGAPRVGGQEVQRSRRTRAGRRHQQQCQEARTDNQLRQMVGAKGKQLLMLSLGGAETQNRVL